MVGFPQGRICRFERDDHLKLAAVLYCTAVGICIFSQGEREAERSSSTELVSSSVDSVVSRRPSLFPRSQA
ncbi:uncharacterized protein BO66DRAFT_390481 [Aspergillus aculeatinus CBS 121060]|uniref:Uncharacterized protein n=1 Tax=Aspergillus aculeatinus CBS 121060 TaxID=1448322 RepID=A0ACD1HF09_9EURO|nr:hypothetical protein BO66DRAFT_390481 [Aspergillus aculeatinus CBS 121060]RAH71993.1 hypothetical protein BO66DRAFT_390481 [Aspergillus aculeatinus CBS 121060]